MAKDYYKILGVDKNATKEEIKSAYKRLAKKFHPDINKESDAAEKFKEINEAAAVLGNEQKREQYDRFGTTGEQFGSGFNGFDFSDFMGDIGGFGFDFDSIFDSFFGGGRRSSKARQGSDLRFELEISLEEAASGVTKHIDLGRNENCDECGGSGAEDGGIKECNDCGGSGYVRQTRRTPFGMFSTSGPCSNCRGKGSVITDACSKCRGKGIIQKTRTITVKVPRGVDDGTRLRLGGEGDAGGQAVHTGDLYVDIKIEEHEFFERNGDDIYCDVPISFVQAVFGDEIEIPTLKGKAKLKIPAGTQPDTIFRMRGKGMPSLHGYGTGDQLVKVIIQVPKKLNARQKEALQKFAKASGESVAPAKSFFSKVRDTLG